MNYKNLNSSLFFKKVWLKRKLVLWTLILSGVLGVVFVITAEKEFTAVSVFIPQVSNSGGGISSLTDRIGGLASLAGINVQGGESTNIPPRLYPDLLQNTQFQLLLLDSPLRLPNSEDTVSFRIYYNELHKSSVLSLIKKYTIGLPGVILSSLRSEEDISEKSELFYISLTSEEYRLIERMKKQVTINPSLREGFVSISVVMPDPYLAAQMTSNLEHLLQDELIRYKTTNANTELKFIQERYQEKKRLFELKQEQLSSFRDKNQNLNTAVAQNELIRLTSEYDLAFNIYTELARQLEQAKLQVSRDTPIFSVIRPVTIPSEKSGPNSLLILVITVFFGLSLYFTYLFLPDVIRDLKYRLEN